MEGGFARQHDLRLRATNVQANLVGHCAPKGHRLAERQEAHAAVRPPHRTPSPRPRDDGQRDGDREARGGGEGARHGILWVRALDLDSYGFTGHIVVLIRRGNKVGRQFGSFIDRV
jgi:hypothetical protein